MEEKLDIHNTEKRMGQSMEYLKADKTIHPRNVQFIEEFLRDCALGKTILNRRKKRINTGTRFKHLVNLFRLLRWSSKPFDELSPEDMEFIIERLESNQILKKDGRFYAEETKIGFKVTMKKFFRWLCKEDIERLKAMTGWMDTYSEVKEVPALTRDQVEQLVEGTGKARVRAVVMLLFDSGARISELLNIRWRDVDFPKSAGEVLRFRIRYSKTKSRTISLPLAQDHVLKWMKIRAQSTDPSAPFVPMSYSGIRSMLARLALGVLGRKITAHLLRHSSATYYCTRLNYYPFCYRYGWSFNSPMPQRYIDRAGLQDQDTVKAIKGEQITRDSEQLQTLKEQMSILRAQHDDLQDHNRRIAELMAPIAKDPRKLEKLMELTSGRSEST